MFFDKSLDLLEARNDPLLLGGAPARCDGLRFNAQVRRAILDLRP